MIGSFSKYKNVLVGVLLLIFSAYYVNSTMFYHSHSISGQEVYHSHFHGSNHTTSDDGGHTLESIILIAALSDISLQEQDFNSHVKQPEPTLESVALVRPTAQATFFLERCGGLRAPPIA